ncbi:hypothetical protein CH379_009095 [Leptospira ellisii]|uniref:Uncharacterized protein n=1 Tax=Leptospira ellisii TaxID=2023197 RepID=A0A2N0BC98_9LEPT|nr:hypothetical protein [Leptospira ellisii]MDV6235781.1 hypothetical protein [Leptospira ellisii]PJZ94170.1 hypothetical protein CH379_04000 [Leptospira ellisii]PKA04966.1 hypothetical protein CH375_07810 [Leptospira ellisii]
MNGKKYLSGLAVLIIALAGIASAYYPERNFFPGGISGLLLIVPFYLLKILVVRKFPQNGVNFQMGIITLSFFINGIALWSAVSQNDSSDFIIGFLIAHFSHFLIVVFAS